MKTFLIRLAMLIGAVLTFSVLSIYLISQEVVFNTNPSGWSESQQQEAAVRLQQYQSRLVVLEATNGDSVYLVNGSVSVNPPEWWGEDGPQLTERDRLAIAKSELVQSPGWVFWMDEISMGELSNMKSAGYWILFLVLLATLSGFARPITAPQYLVNALLCLVTAVGFVLLFNPNTVNSGVGSIFVGGSYLITCWLARRCSMVLPRSKKEEFA